MSAALWSAILASAATGLLGGLHCAGMCGVGLTALISGKRTSPNHTGPNHTSPNVGAPSTARAFRTIAINAAGMSGGGAAAGAVGQHAIQQPNSSNTGAVNSTSGTGVLNLAFNAGRIASYVVAGALVGGLAGGLGQMVVVGDLLPLRMALFLLGQCMIIAAGLTLAGWTALLAPVERIGHALWRHIAPLTRQWLQPRDWREGFVLGTLWGWIPCGLVYAALATTASVAGGNNGVRDGALIMLAFGVGTLPAMLAMGAFASALQRFTRIAWVRQLAGGTIVLLGLAGLARVAQLSDFAAFLALCTGHP